MPLRREKNNDSEVNLYLAGLTFLQRSWRPSDKETERDSSNIRMSKECPIDVKSKARHLQDNTEETNTLKDIENQLQDLALKDGKQQCQTSYRPPVQRRQAVWEENEKERHGLTTLLTRYAVMKNMNYYHLV